MSSIKIVEPSITTNFKLVNGVVATTSTAWWGRVSKLTATESSLSVHQDLTSPKECENVYRFDLENCPCNSKCPQGCPCDRKLFQLRNTPIDLDAWSAKSYECETSVLVLSSRLSNTSVLVSNLGQSHIEDDFITGNWADNTDVQIFESCSVMRNGKITIFGGRENKRQISVVENCEIRRVTTMPFDFRLGGCVTDDSEGNYV